MKSCQACKRSVSDADAVYCSVCGVGSHAACSLAKIVWAAGQPSVQPCCDRCFALWMRSVPPVFRDVEMRLLGELTGFKGPVPAADARQLTKCDNAGRIGGEHAGS